MVKEYNVAILGATGAVGRRMIDQLAKSTIPVKSVKLLASSRSALFSRNCSVPSQLRVKMHF